MKKYPVDIPWWAEAEEREEWILLLAFFYKLMLAYGFRNLYQIRNDDIRQMLNLSVVDPAFVLNESPYTEWMVVVGLKSNTTGVRLNIPQNKRKSRTVTKYLEREEYIMMWVYIMGCFSNNLIEPEDHKQRMGISREWKKIFNGKLLQTSRKSKNESTREGLSSDASDTGEPLRG